MAEGHPPSPAQKRKSLCTGDGGSYARNDGKSIIVGYNNLVSIKQ